jgi:hypothetical protein
MKRARPGFAITSGRAGAALVAVGAAAAIVTGALAGGASAATGTPHPAASPVMVTCTNTDQVRPAQFVLSCADGNWSLSGLHWRTWGATGYATGTTVINDCVPNCALGKFYRFPVSVVVWRPQPLPHHPGVQYFSRVSWVYTGKHCMPGSKGATTCLPVTGTFGLWSHL